MGWIKIDRSILEQPEYFQGPFDRIRCWLDLLLLAEYKQRSFHKRGILVNVQRGEVATSEVELARRWGLCRNTVRKQLEEMEKDGRITTKKSNLVTIITICNYNRYQSDAPEGEEKPPLNPFADEYDNPPTRHDEKKQRQIKHDLYNETAWHEAVCMRYHLQPTDIPPYLDAFFLDAQCRAQEHWNTSDAKRHFANWLRINLDKQKQKEDETNQRTQREQERARRRGSEITAKTADDYHTTF